jgi:hypothetical protein
VVTQEELFAKYRYENGALYHRFKTSSRVRLDVPAGSLNKIKGYWYVRINNKKCLRHRLIFLYHHGWLPKYVDHINCDPQDDRIENLRETSASENNANAPMQCNNKSGYKGVSWHKGSQKWESRIKHKGKKFCLGLYDCPKEAHEAYCKKATEIFGDYARFG